MGAARLCTPTPTFATPRTQGAPPHLGPGAGRWPEGSRAKWWPGPPGGGPVL